MDNTNSDNVNSGSRVQPVSHDNLNKKLAEWVGLEVYLTDTPTGKPEMWEIRGFWVSNVGWIDFTESLDACFKWLVPKLAHCRIEMIEAPYPLVLEGYKGKYAWRITVMGNKRIQDWCDKEPALALCLAIEKLIDEGR